MTHCVDAAVDTVQLPTRDAVSNRSRSQTRPFELSPRYEPMLPPSNLRYLDIGRVDFLTHVGT